MAMPYMTGQQMETNMKLNVNTIEFGGRKAVLNSFSNHPALVNDIKNQRESFASRFPNANVKTEIMEEADVRTLVAKEDHNAVWEIAEASQS